MQSSQRYIYFPPYASRENIVEKCYPFAWEVKFSEFVLTIYGWRGERGYKNVDGVSLTNFTISIDFCKIAPLV